MENKSALSKAICGRPVHTFFTGKNKYLRIQKHCIYDVTPPICENESLFMLVTEGEGTITINGVEFPFNYGSFIWLQSYHTFTIQADQEHPLSISVCVFDYPLASFLTFHEPAPNEVHALIDACPVIHLDKVQFGKINDLFEEFQLEDACFDPGSALIKVAILGQLTAYFIKHYTKQSVTSDGKAYPLGWRATLYISAHFAEKLTVEGVSLLFDINPSALNRELRRISGYNFSQNLNRTRVNIASIALLYEGMSLSYVASHSGFSSEVSFYRIFKQYAGCPPLEYRASILNDGEGVYRSMIMETTLMDILNYSYSSFSSPDDIKEASKNLYISERVIRDLVYEKLGLSYKDLTVLTRIRHAEALLLTTDLPLVDIAVNVGFNCSRSFSRTFYKIYGVKPSEYRKLHQKGNENEK